MMHSDVLNTVRAKSTGSSPELLSPAGDMERLCAAVDFGAQAVYLAGTEFGMRTAPRNFNREDLLKAVQYAHERGVKVYLTCNTLPREEELSRLPEFLKQAAAAGVDAFIITDLGVLSLAKRFAPDVPVHISTQAGVVNHEAACMFYELGASRAVLARELSLEEIAAIRAKTPSAMELEAFVHGSMCVSFSGRCLISNYLTGRDANRGDCAQPCRWNYRLVEEKRPGEYFPIFEADGGTYFFNSKDLCMIEHLPELIEAGITSFKIEGRAKSAYYVAVVTNAYRHALDGVRAEGKDYRPAEWILEEMRRVSHRPYTTGFFFGREPGQNYGDGGYLREYEQTAVCEDYCDGAALVSQRNRFFRGETLEVLEPGREPWQLKVEELFDEEGDPLEVAPHPMQLLRIPSERKISRGAILRKEKKQ